jgi:Na+/proline symporter
LLIAAILAAAMSNLSAALNALSSTTVIDFLLRRRPEIPEGRRVLFSRVTTLVWGLVLFALAILSRQGGRVVEVGLALASVAFGALLGVFLLGVLTRRVNESSGMVAMLCGFLLNLYLWQGRAVLGWLQNHSALHWTTLAMRRDVPWTWYVTLGSSVTFAVGCFVSLVSPPFHRRGR